MKRISIRENGLVGTFFCEGEPTSAVIVLSGSSGGLVEGRAEELAQKGVAGMALAYFGAESLPRSLKQIPLEYFEAAIEWLQKEQKIQRIGLWGTSRGAELSLLLGILFPDRIHAIAAHVPSSVVFGALDDPTQVAWTYRGKPVSSNAPLRIDLLSPVGDSEETALAITPYILASMKEETFAAAAIQVEKLRCPLLLISAQDDQMWPSALFAEQIVDRLSEHQSSIFYTHLSYPGVGHAPAKGEAGMHPVNKKWVVYGGNPHDNAFAAQDWMDQTAFFFKEQL